MAHLVHHSTRVTGGNPRDPLRWSWWPGPVGGPSASRWVSRGPQSQAVCCHAAVLDLMQHCPPSCTSTHAGSVRAGVSRIEFPRSFSALPAPIRLTHLVSHPCPRRSSRRARPSANRGQCCGSRAAECAPTIIAGITQCIMLSLSMVSSQRWWEPAPGGAGRPRSNTCRWAWDSSRLRDRAAGHYSRSDQPPGCKRAPRNEHRCGVSQR